MLNANVKSTLKLGVEFWEDSGGPPAPVAATEDNVLPKMVVLARRIDPTLLEFERKLASSSTNWLLKLNRIEGSDCNDAAIVGSVMNRAVRLYEYTMR